MSRLGRAEIFRRRRGPRRQRRPESHHCAKRYVFAADSARGSLPRRAGTRLPRNSAQQSFLCSPRDAPPFRKPPTGSPSRPFRQSSPRPAGSSASQRAARLPAPLELRPSSRFFARFPSNAILAHPLQIGNKPSLATKTCPTNHPTPLRSFLPPSAPSFLRAMKSLPLRPASNRLPASPRLLKFS